MNMDELEKITYPIGRFTNDPDVTELKHSQWISQIAMLPEELRTTVDGLSDDRLNQRYRPEGWTIRQVVHHLADEHMNGYTYFKMAMTEDEPVIKQYSEPLWAETKDAREAPIEPSLKLLEGLHARWIIFLNSLDDKDFARTYVHRRGNLSVGYGIRLYAWHGRHHTAQIKSLRERKGW